MKYLISAWHWLVFSSADPQRISLTLKGFLMAFATYTTVLAGFANIELPSPLIEETINGVVHLVQQLLMLVATTATVIGLVRKVAMTFAGTNKVID